MEHLNGSERARALAAAFAAVVLFATSFVGIRVLVTDDSLAPGQIVFARLLVASACLGVITLLSGGIRRPQGRDWIAFAALGILGQGLYQLLLNTGERTVDSGTAALLVSCAPIFASVLAVFFLGERLTWQGWLGTAIAFVGAATIAVSAGVSLSMDAGVLLVVGATMLWSCYQVVQKTIAGRYRALELTAWPTWLGTIALLPFAGDLPQALSTAAPSELFAVVWLGAGSSVGGFLAWSYAIKRVPVVVSSNALFGVPVAAFLIGLVVLGETPALGALVGGTIVIAGVALLQTRGRPAVDGAARPASVPRAAEVEVPEPA